ncbi:uL22 family ribosomal protein [Candidatus Vidania fulgoroideorum]
MIIKSSIKNINCSFKKTKKIISILKRYNFKEIFFFLSINEEKIYFYIKKIFFNVINSVRKMNLNISNFKILEFYVSKGVKRKKVFPRAKGKVDFIRNKSVNIFLNIWETK